MNPDPDGQRPRSRLQRLFALLRRDPETREELLDRLRAVQASGVIDVDALAMIEGVLSVSEMQVRDIMIPRAQVDIVPRDANLDEILETVSESAHSRYPVIGEGRDDVVGILIAKDLLRYFSDDASETFTLGDILRPAVFVPESKRLNVLLREFRASRNHMAIVVDEYGGTAGLVTIEDVLEQIVGDIEDEHDFDGHLSHILRHPSGRYIVKALTPIDEFNAFFGTQYGEEEFDTVGGLVVNCFGHLPSRGDEIEMDGFVVRVLRADNRRVHLLDVRKRQEDDGDATGGP